MPSLAHSGLTALAKDNAADDGEDVQMLQVATAPVKGRPEGGDGRNNLSKRRGSVR